MAVSFGAIILTNYAGHATDASSWFTADSHPQWPLFMIKLRCVLFSS